MILAVHARADYRVAISKPPHRDVSTHFRRKLTKFQHNLSVRFSQIALQSGMTLIIGAGLGAKGANAGKHVKGG